jgi:hypothetical protein
MGTEWARYGQATEGDPCCWVYRVHLVSIMAVHISPPNTSDMDMAKSQGGGAVSTLARRDTVPDTAPPP